MKEIVRINLDNEMDLILAHKRSMKIAEMCACPYQRRPDFLQLCLKWQGAVFPMDAILFLYWGLILGAARKEIAAVLTDAVDLRESCPEAYRYAAKISGKIDYSYGSGGSTTTLSHEVPSPGLLSEIKIKKLAEYFEYEPPISAYDEIRRKNIELVALSEKLGE